MLRLKLLLLFQSIATSLVHSLLILHQPIQRKGGLSHGQMCNLKLKTKQKLTFGIVCTCTYHLLYVCYNERRKS